MLYLLVSGDDELLDDIINKLEQLGKRQDRIAEVFEIHKQSMDKQLGELREHAKIASDEIASNKQTIEASIIQLDAQLKGQTLELKQTMMEVANAASGVLMQHNIQGLGYSTAAFEEVVTNEKESSDIMVNTLNESEVGVQQNATTSRMTEEAQDASQNKRDFEEEMTTEEAQDTIADDANDDNPSEKSPSSTKRKTDDHKSAAKKKSKFVTNYRTDSPLVYKAVKNFAKINNFAISKQDFSLFIESKVGDEEFADFFEDEYMPEVARDSLFNLYANLCKTEKRRQRIKSIGKKELGL